MRIRTLDAELWLPLDIEKVFAFFSDARNLDTITPPRMHFSIHTPGSIDMHVGTLIDYRLRVRRVPIRWRSEITAWQPPHLFVDEQRRGPYKLWKHRHEFAMIDGGTLIRDHIEYALPGWFLEPLIQRWCVSVDLHSIFQFRQNKIRELLAPATLGGANKIVLR